MVDNAGYGLFGAAEEVGDEQFLHVLNTNLLGSIRVARAALAEVDTQRELAYAADFPQAR